VDESYDQGRLKEELLAVIKSIWVLFGMELIHNAVGSKSMFVRFFSTDPDGDWGGEGDMAEGDDRNRVLVHLCSGRKSGQRIRRGCEERTPVEEGVYSRIVVKSPT
jgi:hypothetical protein